MKTFLLQSINTYLFLFSLSLSSTYANFWTDQELSTLKQCAKEFQSAGRSKTKSIHALSPVVKKYASSISKLVDKLNDRLFLTAKATEETGVQWTWTAPKNLNEMTKQFDGLDPKHAKLFLNTFIKAGNKNNPETGCFPNALYTKVYQLHERGLWLERYMRLSYSLPTDEFICFMPCFLMIKLSENYTEKGGCMAGILNRLMEYSVQYLMDLTFGLQKQKIDLDFLLPIKS